LTVKLTKTIAAATILTVSAMMATNALADRPDDKGRGNGPVIYVTSQGLFYDSIVLTNLPMRGPFQQLIVGPMGLETEYGPGNVGYRGGRWWLDSNGDGAQNEGDAFFMCPLLGPGRLEP
jgi:hypothetical protein